VTKYFDYAATTPTDPRVVEEMLPYFTDDFGNPNSLYTIGRDAYKALEKARERIAVQINAKPEEVIFTSGGTESDNAALISTLNRLAPDGGAHIITSSYEHHAILEVVEWLEKHGHEATYVKPRPDGHVYAEDIEAAMRPNTKSVSIIMANNEIGTINDIAAIAKVAHAGGALMHTDAVQALGKIPVDVQALGVDLLSLSAHKIYGPRGIGALYLRRGVRFDPLIKGGGQETRRRSGTQNVVGAIGFAKALELAVEEMEDEGARLSELRDYLTDQIVERLENTLPTVDSGDRLPNIAPMLIKGV
jgi:cysteine desulfurase